MTKIEKAAEIALSLVDALNAVDEENLYKSWSTNCVYHATELARSIAGQAEIVRHGGFSQRAADAEALEILRSRGGDRT